MADVLPDVRPIGAAPAWVRLAAKAIPHLPAGRYRVTRWMPGSAPFVMRVPDHAGGFVYRCDLLDVVAREVCFTGRYEPQETAIATSILSSGMTFVDVGANWGYFTLLASRLVGPGGRVVAIEPESRLFSELNDNVRRNGFTNVETVRAAAWDTHARVILDTPAAAIGNSGLTRVAAVASVHDRGIEAVRLDAVIERAGVHQVDLLKMDVEGAEGPALRGLECALRSHRIKRMLLELHPAYSAAFNVSTETISAMLRSVGYRGWDIDHSLDATKRFAYGQCSVAALLRPHTDTAMSGWPHTLWLAPGVELPDLTEQ